MTRYFEKISYEQFKKDISNDKKMYEAYKLPRRKTINSAGYDFMALFDFELKPGEVKRIPTGIKVNMQAKEMLMLVVRSSIGFKYNVRLCNQVGIIESDYYNNLSNEGHIWASIQNHSNNDFVIKQGDAFMQGIFVNFLIVDQEEAITEERVGGIGSTSEVKKMKKNFNIYTAIAYTSGKPHIGNTYEIVLADSIARFYRLMGYNVYFQTGTDEHGQKIALNAKLNNKSTQVYVDEIALEIRRIWDVMNTSYDKFVRTSNPLHKEKVSQIFAKLYKQGDIYKDIYEGLYCVPCESFFTESQLINGKCPDCNRDVVMMKEEAYFLKLSKYAKRLEEHINNNLDFIKPESRKNEIVNNFIKQGLQDLCVTRTSFDWGVPITFDKEHIIYVWIDALSNYITFSGYSPSGDHDSFFSERWPADVHIIGKDILRFHTLYWPIILMALDLPLPRTIYAHPWLLVNDEKMSKSKGNILYADDLVNLFGVDPIRYYMLSQMSYANDGIFTFELLIERINAELVNNLGNLVNRTVNMTYKYFDGYIPSVGVRDERELEFIKKLQNIKKEIIVKMEQYKCAEAINLVFTIFDLANKQIEVTSPWLVAKDEEKKEYLETLIYDLLEAIRFGAVLLKPFLPETASLIFKQLNIENCTYDSLDDFIGLESGSLLEEPKPLYLRINKEEKLKEIVEYYKNV